MKRILISLTLWLALAVSLFAQPLATQQVVFMTRVGNDSSGQPVMRIADSSTDPALARLFNRVMADRGVQRVIASHQEQQQKSMQALVPAGTHLTQRPEPVYIEVGNGVGTYNDWKGTFTLSGSNGQNQAIDQSRVVIDLNDSIFQAQDRSLVEQTFVHEIGHGIMRQVYGKSNLPDTPWLGKAHYGDLITDEALGIIEGWAEFVGAYFTGRNTIAEDPAESISQNAYAYTDNGTPKTPENLMKTEGWVATVLLWYSQHPSITGGYEKLLNAMRQGRHASLNDLLKNLIVMYPETSDIISEILTKASINQISAPLGAPLQSQTPTEPLPAVDVATGTTGGGDQDLTRLFDDYQSSMNTLAQLKTDLVNWNRYPGAQAQEIMRRLTFQQGLVQSLRAQLVQQMARKKGSGTTELIAQKVLDSLEHIRYEHNKLLQSYQNVSFWDTAQKERLKAELSAYQELYGMQKKLADEMDQTVLVAVWKQRQERLKYRFEQARAMQASQAAAPSSSNHCYMGDCKDAYSKLVGAIEANRRSEDARTLLKQYGNSRNSGN